MIDTGIESVSQNSKLKILMTAYDYRPRLGGIATASYELAKNMSALPNVEIKMLTPHISDEDAFFDQRETFKTRRLKLSETAWKAIIPLAREISLELRSWKPDVILNMLWMPDSIATRLSLGLAANKEPYYIYVYGVELVESDRNFKKKIRKILSPIKKSVFKNASGIFSISRFTQGIVESEIGGLNGFLEMTLLGVDSDFFKPEATPTQSRFTFLTVTRLEDYKGIDYVLKALKIVIQKFPEVRYLICGSGPDEARLKQMVNELDLEKNVSFTGVASANELVSLYNSADLFILNSRDDRITPNFEGLGLVLLEAGACGKPCLAGRSGGMPEIVREGLNGFLTDPTDETEIAQKMIEAIENPELLKKMGNAARKNTIENFSWKQVAERVVSRIRADVRN